jgi:hypothetical protein
MSMIKCPIFHRRVSEATKDGPLCGPCASAVYRCCGSTFEITSENKAMRMATTENSKSFTQKVPGTTFKNCPASKPNARITAIHSQKCLYKGGLSLHKIRMKDMQA